MLLPQVLLWPLVAFSYRDRPRGPTFLPRDASETKRQKVHSEGHAFLTYLQDVHERMEETDRVEITPFNPLAAIREKAQPNAGKELSQFFVKLERLQADDSCLPAWWPDAMKNRYHR